MSTKTNKNWRENRHFRVNLMEQVASRSRKHQPLHQAYKLLFVRLIKIRKEMVFTMDYIQIKQSIRMDTIKQLIKLESIVSHQNVVTCLHQQHLFLIHSHLFRRLALIHLMFPQHHP